MSNKKQKLNWTYDPVNYPDQRFNWRIMSVPQKWYTIEAYNRAREARGDERIPNYWSRNHPEFGKGRINVTAPTIGKPAVTPKNWTRADFEKFVQSETGVKEIGSYVQDAIKRFPDVSGSSGSKRQKTGDPTEAPKRKATDQITGPPRSTTTAAPETTTSASTEMPIPGTAGDDDMEGTTQRSASGATGGRGFSGGFATASGPNVTVARPMNFANSGGLVFEKVHRVLAYGVATVNIDHPFNANAATTGEVQLMTTSLMEIPWDRPFFYLSPGEYSSLPKGCYVKHVSIEIVQRNPRVAFETAASTSSLATLNQNKFGIKAIGLNTKNGMRVTNRRYNTFTQINEPMIPTSTVNAVYTDIDTAMYGVDQSVAAFNTSIPASCFLLPIQIPNYLTCWNNSYVADSVSTAKKTGWYSLAEHVTQFDMQATAGTTILKAQYTPTYAPLTEQTAYAEYLRGQLGPVTTEGTGGINFNTMFYTDGDTTKQMSKITINNLTSSTALAPDEEFTNAGTDAVQFSTNLSRYSLMERGQLSKNIDRGDNPKCVQPSVHVGISPVPRLSSTASTIQPNSWTDVQGYYEVKATMHVGYNFPHHNTHQPEFNIEAHDVKMAVSGNDITDIYPVRFGKYHQFNE